MQFARNAADAQPALPVPVRQPLRVLQLCRTARLRSTYHAAAATRRDAVTQQRVADGVVGQSQFGSDIGRGSTTVDVLAAQPGRVRHRVARASATPSFRDAVSVKREQDEPLADPRFVGDLLRRATVALVPGGQPRPLR